MDVVREERRKKRKRREKKKEGRGKIRVAVREKRWVFRAYFD